MNSTATPEDLVGDQVRSIRNATYHRVSALLAGTGLKIEERAHDLVVFNPGDLGKGRVHVSFHDGMVSWERVAVDYLGPLAGYADNPDTSARVGAPQILAVLTCATRLP